MTTTEATPAQVHDGTDLIERAAALRPLLARNAPQCDDDRQ